MDITTPNLNSLFAQLGLPNSDQAIADFIAQHKMADNIHIANADFWNPSQRHFIKESLEEDAQWTEVIDQLDAQLRA